MDFEREDAERVLPNLVIAKRLRRYLCHCVHLNSFLQVYFSTSYRCLWGMRGITETMGAQCGLPAGAMPVSPTAVRARCLHVRDCGNGGRVVGAGSMCWSHCSAALAFARARASLTPLGPHESWHGVPHGALLSGTHPYPCNYSLKRPIITITNARAAFGKHRNSPDVTPSNCAWIQPCFFPNVLLDSSQAESSN